MGLKNLSVIDIARQLVSERHGIDIDPDALDPNDPEVYKIIREGHTEGLFQLESEGMKSLFRGLKKVDFNTLIAGIALYRPGPIKNIPKYQRLANGEEKIEPVHPVYDDITKETFGILVYQEHAMLLAQRMAGYSPGEADVLRKAIGELFAA